MAGCGGTTGRTQKRLNAPTSSPEVEWFTGWRPCVGMDTVLAAVRIRAAKTDYFLAKVAVQVATVRTNEPDDYTTLGESAIDVTSGSGESLVLLSLTSTTPGKAFVRFGIEYNSSSGVSSADVDMDIAFLQCGDVAGAATLQLFSTTTTSQFVALTGWLPALLVQKVTMALMISSKTGSPTCQLAYRTAELTTDEPGAWDVVPAGSSYSTEGDHNTGDLTVSLSTVMWVQLGLKYVSSSGDGQMTVAASVGTRRS